MGIGNVSYSTRSGLRWLARLLLVFLLGFGLWLSLQPSLSLSPWTPNRLMRALGMPYDWILAYEHLLPYGLHILVGALLALLLYFSDLFGSTSCRANLVWTTLVVLGAAIAAEGVQYLVGRGFETWDVVFTALGILPVAGILLKVSRG